MKKKKFSLFLIICAISSGAIYIVYSKTSVGLSGTMLKDLDNNDITKWYILYVITLIVAFMGWVAYKLLASMLKKK